MKIKLITCLLIGLFAYAPAISALDDLFVEGTLEQVEAMAAREGKLYFVDFYANWCLPCKWMDETTFSDPEVANFLRANYIPTKVNIDDFDGFKYKEQYNVRMLPTFIIFNSSGNIVGRFEESMPPSKMLNLLKDYNTPENKIKRHVPEPIVEAPINQPVTIAEEPVIEAPEYAWNDDVYRVPVEKEEPKIEEVVYEETAVFQEEIAVEEEIVVKEIQTIVNAPEVISEAVGLFQFSVNPQEKSGYAVQVGVFGKYGNVLRESTQFQSLYGHDIIVSIVRVEGKEIYKLMLGSFADRYDAQTLVNQIIEDGREAMIKDLSKL